jgi:hypothetical protein
MFTFEFNDNDFSNLEIKNNILEGGRGIFYQLVIYWKEK